MTINHLEPSGTTRELTLGTLNVRDLKTDSKKTALCMLLEDNEVDLVALTETWHSEDEMLLPEPYLVVCSRGKETERGGAAWVCTEQFQMDYELMALAPRDVIREDVCWIQLKLPAGQMAMASVYAPCAGYNDETIRIFYYELDADLQWIKDNLPTTRVVLMGDFNCNPMQPEKRQGSAEGSKCLEILMKAFNMGAAPNNAPTFRNISTLDWFIASSSLAPEQARIHTLEMQRSLTDHNLVLVWCFKATNAGALRHRKGKQQGKKDDPKDYNNAANRNSVPKFRWRRLLQQDFDKTQYVEAVDQAHQSIWIPQLLDLSGRLKGARKPYPSKLKQDLVDIRYKALLETLREAASSSLGEVGSGGTDVRSDARQNTAAWNTPTTQALFAKRRNALKRWREACRKNPDSGLSAKRSRDDDDRSRRCYAFVSSSS
jgi:hypothetical protein